MRLFITHDNADLDGLASCVAARALYGGGTIVRNRAVSAGVKRYLALHKDSLDLVGSDDPDLDEVGEVVVVDTRRRGRLREYEGVLEAARRLIVFDHHPASRDDLRADETHVERVGACVTLLTERLRDANSRLERPDATLMLAGLYADTGRLSYECTTARDVDAAGWLMRQGAKLSVANRYLRPIFSAAQKHALIRLVEGTRWHQVNGIEVALLVGSFERFVDGLSLVVDEVARLGGHDVVFGVVEFARSGRVQVVGRSRLPYVDVGRILDALGGGGHPGAGACTFKEVDVESVVDRLMAQVDRSALRPERVRDVMSSPVQLLRRDLSLGDAQKRLRHWNISGAPVLTQGRLEGVLSRRDIARAAHRGALHLPVSSHMSHSVAVIEADETLEYALKKLTEEDVGRLPVCEGGHLVGIVTRSDLLRHLYQTEHGGA